MLVRITLAIVTLLVPIAYGVLLKRFSPGGPVFRSRLYLIGWPVSVGLMTAGGYSVVTETFGIAVVFGLVAYFVAQIAALIASRLAGRMQTTDGRG